MPLYDNHEPFTAFLGRCLADVDLTRLEARISAWLSSANTPNPEREPTARITDRRFVVDTPRWHSYSSPALAEHFNAESLRVFQQRIENPAMSAPRVFPHPDLRKDTHMSKIKNLPTIVIKADENEIESTTD